MRITCQNFNFQLEKTAREIAFHHFGSFLTGPACRPSCPYNLGTEYVGFSPTRQTSVAPSVKRREVFGESHEG